MPQNDVLKMLLDNEERLKQTETRETPGNITGFTAFYTSGIWTPTFVGLTIAGTFTYGATTAGDYTRIGNTVFLRGRIALTAVAVAPTGVLTIQGLPITPATVTSGVAGIMTPGYWSLIGIGGGAKVYLGGWIQSAATNRIDLVVSASGGTGAVFLTGAVAALANGSDILFSGQYQV